VIRFLEKISVSRDGFEESGRRSGLEINPWRRNEKANIRVMLLRQFCDLTLWPRAYNEREKCSVEYGIENLIIYYVIK
jgi:hypothetical protein